MLKKFKITLLIVICLASVSIAQRGKDGAKTITVTNTVVNEYTYLTTDASAGNTTLQVFSSGLNNNNRFGYVLQPGDLLMIIQIQGVTIDTGSWWVNFGYILNYNNCGNYEFAEVKSVPNSTSVELSCGLKNNYTAAGRVQVIRVPRYSSLNLNAGTGITCDAWNGSYGGVVAVEVVGLTQLAAGSSVDVSTKGFRGGVNTDMSTYSGITIYACLDILAGGEKGEGIAGNQDEYNAFGGRYCRNAAANGGGGGNSHNAGGGGGANARYYLIWDGRGNPDTNTSSWIPAWDLESADFHKNVSDGGGRGGYTYSWVNLDATVVPPGDVSWGGDSRRNVGGQGGHALDYSSGRLFMGGGGGSGDQGEGTAYGGDGGNGGGIIYFITYDNITGSGQFLSNGENGGDANGTAPLTAHAGVDGAGGAGGAGTIILKTAGSVQNTISILANGGAGGNQLKTKGLLTSNNGEAEGPGGGGGGGYIAISSGTPTRTANGGNNGISTAQTPADCGVTEFPPNGATKGGRGENAATVDFFTVTATGDSVCSGDTAFVIAQLTGTIPPGITVTWWDDDVAGNVISTGDTLVLPNLINTTDVYVGTCPGIYRVKATVYVSSVTANAGTDIFLCNGNSDTLNGSGGLSYLWTPGTGLSDSLAPDPVVSPVATTTYNLQVTDLYGCTDVDAVTVNVNTVTASLTPDTSICEGDNVSLIASGGASYNWNTGDTTSSIIVSPISSQFYYVTVTAFNCSDSAHNYLTVYTLPQFSLGNDTSLCNSDTLILSAGNPGSFYLWQDSSVSQTYNVITTGDYFVNVTNINGCSARDSIRIDYYTVVAVSTNDTAVCLGEILSLNASGGLNYLWNTGDTTQNINITPVTSQNYYVTVSSGYCSDTSRITVDVYPVPNVFLGNDTGICTGDTLILDAGNPGNSYVWQDMSVNNTYIVTLSGNYSVTVINTEGCYSSDDIDIIASPYADATISNIPDICSNISYLTLSAAQPGGIWSGNGITDSVTGRFEPADAGQGVHVIYYTIAGQCGDSDSTSVKVNIAQGLVFDITQETCLNSEDASIDMSVVNGTPPFTIIWSNGEITEDIDNLAPGDYSVTVTDSNGCVALKNTEIDASLDECFVPHIYIPNIFTPNSDNNNDIFYIRGSGITSLVFIIYDRWGEKVFETTDPNSGWDGTFRGEPVEPDVYMYYVKADMSNGQTMVKKGNITLLRSE